MPSYIEQFALNGNVTKSTQDTRAAIPLRPTYGIFTYTER